MCGGFFVEKVFIEKNSISVEALLMFLPDFPYFIVIRHT